jgi:hypothetical protein
VYATKTEDRNNRNDSTSEEKTGSVETQGGHMSCPEPLRNKCKSPNYRNK